MVKAFNDFEATAQTMFGVPRWTPGVACDVVFVGVPSDMGTAGSRSPAAGPMILRAMSNAFPARVMADGRSGGWFDYAQAKTVLSGIRMTDAGNVKCNRLAGGEQFVSLPDTYRRLREAAGLLVVLSGDHSLAYRLGQAIDGEGIVWLDAHDDAVPIRGSYPDCTNVVSYIDELESVPLVAQYGLRGFGPPRPTASSARRVHCRVPKDVVIAFQQRGVTSAVVTIDVDVLDPSIMPAVASPMPDGLRIEHVIEVFVALRSAGIRITALEITEFAPTSDADAVAALTLLNLLLRAMSECLAT